MKRAWPAAYAFIRASGRRSEEATELTQAFICDVFLARRLLEKADQSRGRFRTLLIGAVRNYLADTHRRATAAIRAPKSSLIAIDAMSESGFDMTSDGARSAPERAFNARFVAGLIRAASERLQRELESEGDHASWEIFRLRVRMSFEPPSLIRTTCSTRSPNCFPSSRGDDDARDDDA